MKSIVLNHSLRVFLIACTLIIVSMLSCKKDLENDSKDEPGTIQGAPGNPRFNLQFTNGSKTDLDLYVQTPNGSIIYYANPAGQNGQLDVDCLCGDCPNGPNENIYWTPGTAVRGTYKVWVEYYGDCDGRGSSSNYTLRIMNNSSVIQTFTGSLSPNNDKSTVHTFNY